MSIVLQGEQASEHAPVEEQVSFSHSATNSVPSLTQKEFHIDGFVGNGYSVSGTFTVTVSGEDTDVVLPSGNHKLRLTLETVEE